MFTRISSASGGSGAWQLLGFSADQALRIHLYGIVAETEHVAPRVFEVNKRSLWRDADALTLAAGVDDGAQPLARWCARQLACTSIAARLTAHKSFPKRCITPPSIAS